MECIAFNGQKVPHGEIFFPGPDYCTKCTCDEGKAHLCRAVLCQSPQDCKYFRIGETCCDFICLDDMLPSVPHDINRGTTSDMGLRMVGSTITAILSLALLLFLIHRLRQRKRRDAQRQQFEENLDNVSGLPSDSCHSNPCCHSAVYVNGNDQDDLYFDHHSPSSPWKTHCYFQHREPPPTYNEAVRNDPQSMISTSAFSVFPPMRPAVQNVQMRHTPESTFGGVPFYAPTASELNDAFDSLSDGTAIIHPEDHSRAILSDQVYEDTLAISPSTHANNGLQACSRGTSDLVPQSSCGGEREPRDCNNS